MKRVMIGEGKSAGLCEEYSHKELVRKFGFPNWAKWSDHLYPGPYTERWVGYEDCPTGEVCRHWYNNVWRNPQTGRFVWVK